MTTSITTMMMMVAVALLIITTMTTTSSPTVAYKINCTLFQNDLINTFYAQKRWLLTEMR